MNKYFIILCCIFITNIVYSNQVSEINQSEIIIKNSIVTIIDKQKKYETNIDIDYKNNVIQIFSNYYNNNSVYSEIFYLPSNKYINLDRLDKLDLQVSLVDGAFTKGVCSRSAVKKAMDRVSEAVASGASVQTIIALINNVYNALNNWIDCVLHQQ